MREQSGPKLMDTSRRCNKTIRTVRAAVVKEHVDERPWVCKTVRERILCAPQSTP